MATASKFVIGESAGYHFNGQADLTVARHVTCGSRQGVFLTRKWLYDRKAYEYDPRLGWAVEHWFEWRDDKQP